MAFLLSTVIYNHGWSYKKPQVLSPSIAEKCLQGYVHSNQFQMGYEWIFPTSNTAYIVNQRWWTLQNFSQDADVSSKNTAHISGNFIMKDEVKQNYQCSTKTYGRTLILMAKQVHIWDKTNWSINVHEKYQ